MDEIEKVKVSAVQAAPVYLDRDATIGKACALVEHPLADHPY